MIDLKQRDKQLHFLGGAVLSFMFSFIVTPLMGLFVAVFVGWGKEQYDKHNPKKHTYDPLDMFATWLGGIAGVILFISFRAILYE